MEKADNVVFTFVEYIDAELERLRREIDACSPEDRIFGAFLVGEETAFAIAKQHLLEMYYGGENAKSNSRNF